MARIPYVDQSAASDETSGALDALPSLNIFRMLAHAEDCFVPALSLGRSILGSTTLSPALRELAVLQAAKEAGAEYEWVQHVEIGRHAGVETEQIEAIAAGDQGAPCFSEVERAVLSFTIEVVGGPTVGDNVFAAVSERLSSRELVELLLTVGYYVMLARVMTVLELEIDDAIGNQVVDLSTAE